MNWNWVGWNALSAVGTIAASVMAVAAYPLQAWLQRRQDARRRHESQERALLLAEPILHELSTFASYSLQLTHICQCLSQWMKHEGSAVVEPEKMRDQAADHFRALVDLTLPAFRDFKDIFFDAPANVVSIVVRQVSNMERTRDLIRTQNIPSVSEIRTTYLTWGVPGNSNTASIAMLDRIQAWSKEIVAGVKPAYEALRVHTSTAFIPFDEAFASYEVMIDRVKAAINGKPLKGV